MGKKLMVMKFVEEDDGKITMSTKFAENVPVAHVFDMIGKGVSGLVQTAAKIGEARGLTPDQIEKAMGL